MKIYYQTTKYKIMLLLFVLYFSFVIYADNGIPTFNISVPRTSINIGDPLVVELEYHFNEPQVSNKNVIFNQIEPEAYLLIEKEGITIYRDRLPYPFYLIKQDEAGLEYKGTFIIWYNVIGKKLSFNEPGEYIIRTALSKESLSNPVKITVKSETKKAQKALTAFNDLFDYLFLFIGSEEFADERDGVMERLKQVQKQSEGTMLEKWSAARIGISYFKDIQNVEEEDQSKIDEIHKFLNKGIELPDDFPVREESLYDLAYVEDIKGDKERANSLRYELINKYPKGKFAKKTKTILARMGNTVEIINQPESGQINHNTHIYIICGLSMVALIGIVILIGKMERKKT